MLDADTLNKFIAAVNRAHQQLCVWFETNNQFARHFVRWNKLDPDIGLFSPEDFTKRHGSKYKNFWSVIIASTQHGWILGAARLFDPAYNSRDKQQKNPRISLAYILSRVSDKYLKTSIESQLREHQEVVDSLISHRNNVLAHNDLQFQGTHIKAGVETLFVWLEKVVEDIKKSDPRLANCKVVNIAYNEKLSKCGVDEVFDVLLLGEKNEPSK